ncbi:hypothetical protein [Vibrio toranzoniae]|uniref:hypothetical protein n=1 Tax=Vibrio toranzoniae TaxID=1194427 RepID=UPI001929BB96|nr:hypothetical protein [Vibrio toranzoniae]NAZ72043.1 hypothetical protein [Vibrio toranzoniae]
MSNIPVENTTWVSSEGMSIFIERVSEVDDDGFYLVEIIDTASKGDSFAAGDELTSREWEQMVSTFGLQVKN